MAHTRDYGVLARAYKGWAGGPGKMGEFRVVQI